MEDYICEEEDNRQYEKKYFCFDLDAEKEGDWLAFYTGETPDCADDCPPSSVYQELNDLLSSHIPNIDIGAAESMHIICEGDENIEQWPTLKNTVREILTDAGWIELDGWDCRK